MASTPESLLLAWSGGKDSTCALAALRRSTRWRVAGLLTTVTEDYDRISIHGVRRSLLNVQVAALRLPLTIVEIPAGSSNESYETRMRDALHSAAEKGIRSVAFGDLFLADVRTYREDMLRQADVSAVFPIWHQPTDRIARDFIAAGYRAIITCVDTAQVPAELVGREFDAELLADLPEGADPCGENGEFHTFVYDGPLFESAVPWVAGERVLRDDRFMYQDLLDPIGEGSRG